MRNFNFFKDMDLLERVHIYGLSKIHSFDPNFSLIRLFKSNFNGKPRI